MKKLGLIICDHDSPTSLKWTFQTYEGADTRVQQFVQVQAEEGYMLGKITSVRFFNDYFTDQTFVGHFIRNDRQVEERYPINKHMIKLAFVQSLGIWKEGKFHAPIVPPFPGAVVSEADPEIFSKYLGVNPEGLYLGKALNQEEIRILIDTNRLLSHHIAILGATGSGKSYTNGVLCEELLDIGIPIVVIDPHGEFESLGEKNTNPREVEEMKRFGVSQNSYRTKEYAPSFARKKWQVPLTVDIGKLETETIGELVGLNSDAQLDLLFLSIKTLIERFGRNELTIPRLLDFIEIVGRENSDNRTMMTVKRRISVLSKLGIFGKSLDSKELVQKGTLTVIDLSEDVEERLKRALCAAILTTLFEARKNKEIPPFLVVVEESHRFCPQDDECASKQVIRRLTREGRKFGVGVCLTSQRVIGLDKDSFSQCGTKITLRIDNKSDLDYIRPYLGLSNSEEFDMIPTLPEGVAVISGICVRTPIVFRVRVRKSMHKGESAEFVRTKEMNEYAKVSTT